MSRTTTRQEIVAAADDLFYRQGFDHTSFAHIADAVGISRGNFYHHFKTKDEILDSVIEKRIADRMAMMQRWEIGGATPEERILSFVEILTVNGAKIMHYGCPIGTLTSELAKLNHAARSEANKLFTIFRTWLARQFRAAGCEEADADRLAMHLLMRSQGVATLLNAFHDTEFAAREVQLMREWVSASLARPPDARGSASSVSA
ncbi:TetR/AcrR family transcriptional regulator [Bosea sp. LC85]|uniref:TetR/AcrR family transcriptional regulator n=1 Tax=Bosea sp. LC85 TaxID=1502851 RepID=UPI0006978F19|nr:TetR/AcrR family transcriptional regulator [Bosea sp. LC85]